MSVITIPNFVHHDKFGFYLRKALFQVFLPIFLAFLSLCDFVNQSGKQNNGYAYNHLYFYTSLILFFYASAKYCLDFIFSTCADDIVFKKEINLEQTTPDLILAINIDDIGSDNQISFGKNDHFIILIKKIFKIRFSDFSFFQNIVKMCDFLGIECPILIPIEVISRLTNNGSAPTIENEEAILQTTLYNLYSYRPQKYRIEPELDDENMDPESLLRENLIPRHIVSRLDKTINDIQKELFNRPSKMSAVNV